MTIPTIYIDGTGYTFPCSIERKPEKRESDNSGYMMNKKYHADYLGTYITYSVSVSIPLGQENRYANLFELLALPKGEYTFTLPYNQETVTFDGIIRSLSDKLFRVYKDVGHNNVNLWRNISFEIQSIEPIIDNAEAEEEAGE